MDSPSHNSSPAAPHARSSFPKPPLLLRVTAALVWSSFLGHGLVAAPASDGGEFVNLEKLSDRVMVAYWVGMDRRCNLTALRTDKGLVIIDTEMSPHVMAPIKEKLEKAFGRSDWAYVINTHAHDNHAGGNSLFKGAAIVGHQNLAEDMRWMIRRQTEPDWKKRDLASAEHFIQKLRAGLPQVAARSLAEARLVRGEIKFLELHTQDLQEGYELVRPSLVFSNELTLDLGDLRLELVFFGKGHSLSDILIYVPQEELLVTGAIIYQRGQFPEVGEQTTLADMQRFLAVLDGFLAANTKVSRVIPAHSPPLLKKDLAPVRDYYQRMLSGVRLAQQRGLTLEQTKVQLPASTFPAFWEKPPGNWSHGMHDRNLRNLWQIVRQTNAPPKNS